MKLSASFPPLIRLFTLLAALPAAAHSLTNVPMQGDMIHVGIGYHADHGMLHVHIDPGTPELVAVGQMDNHSDFVSTDPWYSDLGRDQGNRAFNRQYGFVIDGESDPLPAGSTIRIRQLSATAGLQAFRYRGTDPKAWEPLFGTAGSTNTLAWNLVMFHPAYTAPLGSGPHQAEYEAVLVNADNGLPVAGVTAAAFTLKWNVRGQAMPNLGIALKLVLSWPAPSADYRVEVAESMNGPWALLPELPAVVNGQYLVLAEPQLKQRFFRLRPAGQP